MRGGVWTGALTGEMVRRDGRRVNKAEEVPQGGLALKGLGRGVGMWGGDCR